MRLLEILAEYVGSTFSAGDVPGGRSIFGPVEPFIPLFSPVVEGRDPTIDDFVDAGSAAGHWSGPASETYKEGTKNVRDYNGRRTELIESYFDQANKGVEE